MHIWNLFYLISAKPVKTCCEDGLINSFRSLFIRLSINPLLYLFLFAWQFRAFSENLNLALPYRNGSDLASILQIGSWHPLSIFSFVHPRIMCFFSCVALMSSKKCTCCCTEKLRQKNSPLILIHILYTTFNLIYIFLKKYIWRKI